jgi:hypothetical protein
MIPVYHANNYICKANTRIYRELFLKTSIPDPSFVARGREGAEAAGRRCSCRDGPTGIIVTLCFKKHAKTSIIAEQRAEQADLSNSNSRKLTSC